MSLTKPGQSLRHQISGLSLIEIVIVLAISGLIFTLVFLALPIAQRGRRDAQRKQYLHEVSANLEKYKESSANDSKYPAAANFPTAFGAGGTYHVSGVLSDKDPLNGTAYSFTAGLGSVTTPAGATPASIDYVLGTNCANSSGQGNGIYSLTIGLEGGTYCLDNH